MDLASGASPQGAPKASKPQRGPGEWLVYVTGQIHASAEPAPRGPVWTWSYPFASAGPPSGGTMSGEEGLSGTLRLAPGPEPEPKATLKFC